MDDSDDDVPISELRKRKAQDDSDDDVPIAQLVKKRKDDDVAKKRLVDKKTPVDKKPPVDKKTDKKKKKKSSAESVFYETQRGRLVQALLRRWWYVIDWPSEAAEKVPEEHFEVLPGFPGVHICTSGARLGEIIDHRDHTTSPCFTNLYKKPTRELKALVATAIDKQIQQLDDDAMIKSLKADAKDLSRINPDKADTEANKAVQVYDAARRGRKV